MWGRGGALGRRQLFRDRGESTEEDCSGKKGGGRGGGGGEEENKGHRKPNQTQSGGQTKHNQRGGRDYQSGGGLDCLAIVLILFMTADVVISTAGAMPGDAWQVARQSTWPPSNMDLTTSKENTQQLTRLSSKADLTTSRMHTRQSTSLSSKKDITSSKRFCP